MNKLLITCAGALLFVGVLVLPTEQALSAAGGRGGQGEHDRMPRDAHPRVPGPGDHQCAVCRAAERLGIQLTPAYGITRFRCCDQPPLAMRWPGGRMRPEDLSSLPMELTADFDPDTADRAEVRILAGEHLLYAESSTYPDADFWSMTTPYRLHRQAHIALRGVRSQLTLSFRFVGYGPELRRQFWLERPEPVLQARLRDLRQAGADDHLASRTPWLATLLEAQLYWEAGFDFAAEKLARRVLEQRVGEPHALGIQYAVYRAQRFEDTCDGQLTGSVLQHAVDQRTQAGTECHLRADFDPVAGRTYTRPRAGCGPRGDLWKPR